MPDSAPVPQPILLDGVAGLELANLEAWVVEWFTQYGKGVFKTVDRWRGQFREEGGLRKSFQAPALFLTMLGTVGAASGRGGTIALDVEFGGVVVAKNGARADLPQANQKDRYALAVALASAMCRLLFVMDPPNLTQAQRDANAPRSMWKRPSGIRFKNVYTEDVDKMGLSLIEFRWVHELHVADVNLNCLPDLATIFGEMFPNVTDQSNPPVTGEVDFTT